MLSYWVNSIFFNIVFYTVLEHIFRFAHFAHFLHISSRKIQFLYKRMVLKLWVKVKGWLTNLTPRFFHKFQVLHSLSCILYCATSRIEWSFEVFPMWSLGDNWSAHSFLSEEHFSVAPIQFHILIQMNWLFRTIFQKQESFLKPLVDQFAKEGKDKKVTFEAIFTKPNAKPKWFFRKDVS